MGKLNDKLDADLKKAMLARDSRLVSVLRGLKSSLQYAQVAQGSKSELSEQDMTAVLQKEAKKRAEAANIYVKADDQDRVDQEKYEEQVINGYLPEMLSREEVAKLVDEAAGSEDITPQTMGKIISQVRERSNGLAEGSLIAEIVKERIK